jgi:3-deoxy-D-manno-octulosonic-acid transferase
VLPLYNLSIKLYLFAIRFASFRHRKAAAWLAGRADVFGYLQQNIPPNSRIIWIHCSSAGEFEQGKPVIEALKKTYPAKKFLVTFFSPSGYKVAENYPFADMICYLPLDTRQNAERFIKLVNPDLAIFVKYEFWFHFLSVAAFHHIPTLLVSAVFRKPQVFFRPFGRFFRQMLFLFRHLFVQDNASLQLLHSIGATHCTISGDTRFDRVVKVTSDQTPIPFIDNFIDGQKVIIAGSTWPGDEEVLAEYVKSNPVIKLVIAPHEINTAHLASLQRLFPCLLLYSSLQHKKQPISLLENQYSGSLPASEAGNQRIKQLKDKQVLVIDSVGLLSRLYQYATISYVGGGYTKDGIHNILEAAVWGKPVLFGPNYQKYREAKELIKKGGAFSFRNTAAFKALADGLLQNNHHLQETGLRASAYIRENTGATEKILQVIQEKRLLTN